MNKFPINSWFKVKTKNGYMYSKIMSQTTDRFKEGILWVGDNLVKTEDLEQIELTKEILEANGFNAVENMKNSVLRKAGDYLIYVGKQDGGYYSVRLVYMMELMCVANHIKYVDELQQVLNIYAIEELNAISDSIKIDL